MSLGQILGGIGGLAGLFGGQKADPYAKASADSLRQRQSIIDQILAMARGYDPSKETQTAVDYANKQGANTLANAMGTLNQRFKVSGGSPSGDTNFGFMSQRTTDDVLNPLAQFVANRKANEFSLKMQPFLSVLGGSQGMSQAWNQAGQYNQSTQPDLSGSMGMIAGALNGSQRQMNQSPLEQVSGSKNYGQQFGPPSAQTYFKPFGNIGNYF